MKPPAALFLLSVALVAQAQATPLQDGDIIFHTSKSAQSIAVQKATGSRYSHMGVIIMRKGAPQVFEAVQTVRYTPLDRWISHGVDAHFVVKRLKTANATFNPSGIARLHAAAKGFEGRPYDLTFEWSDQRIYCSELVWKIYDRAFGLQIGQLKKASEFNLTDPIVRKTQQERYGRHFPKDEPVISPIAMYDSPLLETVLEK